MSGYPVKSVPRVLGVSACGIITYSLTVIGIMASHDFTDSQRFTFTIWLLCPVGAVAAGVSATSGYYFGSLFFHRRPTPLLLIQIILISAISQLLIYNPQELPSLYLYTSLSHVLVRIVHLGKIAYDNATAGDFGYWLAASRLIGFVAGAGVIFIKWFSNITCPLCNDFFQIHLLTCSKQFENREHFLLYYGKLLALSSKEFEQEMRLEKKLVSMQEGAIQLDTTLNGCHACRLEMVVNKISTWNGRRWQRDGASFRRILLPNLGQFLGVPTTRSSAR